jgi:hypothetical protein
MSSAFYSSSVRSFLDASPLKILGALSSNSGYADEVTQKTAWREQIEILRTALDKVDGGIHLEFVVPRIGTRVDAVVVSGSVVFVIEFKVGQKHFLRQDVNQVWDYALDLKNFHRASHQAAIIPVLVATEADQTDSDLTAPHSDGVFPPLKASPSGLGPLIHLGLSVGHSSAIDPLAWADAPYTPTPTIIEAAQALFSGHSVKAISQTEAGLQDLQDTSNCVENIIQSAQRNRNKAIVLLTGVPGAGKTLVGLNIATQRREGGTLTHAVFLSGNGPLVKVLRAALTEDSFHRRRRLGNKIRKGSVEQEVKAFIQNVHHYRDAYAKNSDAPSDHIAIFDEAQRAWNQHETAKFMKGKGFSEFPYSEPEFLISCLDRHSDWAVVICLVGGGQEINRGEAGIGAWIEAVTSRFRDWHIYLSPELMDSEYAAMDAINSLHNAPNVKRDKALHLAVSVRSFRAEHLSRFVKSLLDMDRDTACEILPELREYPVALTRDLRAAKAWLRDQARGSERYGLLASSGAERLKPHAIDVRVDVDPVKWFLKGPEDTRSSFYLEDAATEFDVQGLEVDWACVTWDADLRYTSSGWSFHDFRGSKWTKINQTNGQQYLKNAYRVLLTRARQGLVICIPEGDSGDPTRSPAYYDSTFRYLVEIGIPTI